MSKKESRIIVIGRIPPPITGCNIVTSRIIDELRNSGDFKVYYFSISVGSGLKSFIAKLFSHIWALLRILIIGTSGRPAIYVVAGSQGGVFISAIFVFFAKFFARDVIVHHHGFRWISKYNVFLQKTLFRNKLLHVTQCATMGRHLDAAYDVKNSLSLSNAFLVEDGIYFKKDNGEFLICHMSNLTLEKGLEKVLKTYEMLLSNGLSVSLRLGGRASDPYAKRLLDTYLLKFPEIDYWGQVEFADKVKFFNGCDVFLFPSLYRVETQGIVTLEAMSYGIPLIAYPRCCIKETLELGGGIAVMETQNYVDECSSIISSWIDEPEKHARARMEALNTFNSMKSKSHIELDNLIERIKAGFL